jgi:hypothetical protein
VESERRSGKYQVLSSGVLRNTGDPGDVEERPWVEEVARSGERRAFGSSRSRFVAILKRLVSVSCE